MRRAPTAAIFLAECLSARPGMRLSSVRAPIRKVPAASTMLSPEIARTCERPAARNVSTAPRLIARSSPVTSAAAIAPVSPPIAERMRLPIASRTGARYAADRSPSEVSAMSLPDAAPANARGAP